MANAKYIKTYTMFREGGQPFVTVTLDYRSGGKRAGDYRLMHRQGDGGQFDWGQRNRSSQCLAYCILADFFATPDRQFHVHSREYVLMNQFGAEFLWFDECNPEHGLMISQENITEWLERIEQADKRSREPIRDAELRQANHEE